MICRQNQSYQDPDEDSFSSSSSDRANPFIEISKIDVDYNAVNIEPFGRISVNWPKFEAQWDRIRSELKNSEISKYPLAYFARDLKITWPNVLSVQKEPISRYLDQTAKQIEADTFKCMAKSRYVINRKFIATAYYAHKLLKVSKEKVITQLESSTVNNLKREKPPKDSIGDRSGEQRSPNESEKLIKSIIGKDRKKILRIITDQQWQKYLEKVKSSDLKRILIKDVAAKIGAPWPVKSKFTNEVVAKYFEYSLDELFSVKGFGKSRASTYIGSVIHLADSIDNEGLSAQSPEKATSLYGATQRRIDQLIEFSKLHSHFDVPRESSRFPGLRTWIDMQRHKRRKGELGKEIEEAMEAVGFTWEITIQPKIDKKSVSNEFDNDESSIKVIKLIGFKRRPH
ncbi:Helicase associated domain protein [Opitutaceae bacterium]|nr:Helicase associated domain protein [Opitutaceae bacterium]